MRISSRFSFLVLSLACLCAGLSARAEVFEVGATAEPGLALQSQSASSVAMRFALDRFATEPVALEGETLQKITMTGAMLPNDAGAPDLAGVSRFVAVPQGAQVTFEIVSARTEVFEDIVVAPAPVIPREDDDSPLVYTKNLSIYERDAYYPQSPVMISEPTQLRGVDAVMVGVTPFQYNPVTRELVVYTELEVRIDFVGGNGQFGEERLRSRYWEPILRDHLLNYESLPAVDFNTPPRGNREGAEYIIITPTDPGFVQWAETLREWRTLQGVSTEVFTTDETGTTWTAIEAFLNNAYSTWDPAPVAFLILADYPNSGDGGRDVGIVAPIWDGYCASDNIYADVNGDDLPDMAHGRICARDAAELGHMITKMLDYEQNPYTDEGFYDHPVIAGGWQTERWFIFCTEIIWGHQNIVLGKNPVREYAIYSGTPGTLWSTNQNTPIVLAYFGPEGLGYIPQTPEHLTDWGGNATRLNNDLNAGAYMLLHRDHGSVTGWGEPDYDIYDLNGLTNEMYPFVFSINCLTGQYDGSQECFSERFHRMTYGALGVIAASDVSYSFVNDTFIWGMFDGLWHDFMPDYGPYPVDNDFRYPAFGMASGKHFLQSSSWPYNPQSKDVTHHLFHHHGDAFLTMYTEVPQALTVSHEDVLFIGVDYFTVTADEGALIALTVDGEIIGVATATGGPLDVPIIPQTNPGDLTITVTKPDYFRYQQTVPILPPQGPYLVFESCTVLDQEWDDDGELDAGETVDLEVVLENVGVDGTTNVSGTLATNDAYTTILDGEAAFPDIGAGGTGTSLEPFAVQLAGNAPDQHEVVFDMHVTSDQGAWDCTFRVTAQAPVLTTGQVLVNDEEPYGNGDGSAGPGETVYVLVWLSNEGHSPAGPLTGTLATTNPHVTILDGEASCIGVPLEDPGLLASFQVALSASCPDPSTIEFDVQLTGEYGFEAGVQFSLDVGGWLDTAETDRGWTLGVAGDDATTGVWVREEPIGTVYDGHQIQTEYDHTPDPAEICFVTGNGTPGGSAGENDVDGGKTTLATPVFDLSGASAATITYWRWYTNSWGGSPDNDWWNVDATADGENWVSLEHTMQTENSWTEHTFDLGAYLGTLTDRVQIRFVAADEGDGSLVEAAVDDFLLTAVMSPASEVGIEEVRARNGFISFGPNPVGPRTTVVYRLGGAAAVDLDLYDVSGRLVRSLVDATVPAGTHAVAFDGRDARGQALASGIYFLRLETPDILQVKQVTVLR